MTDSMHSTILRRMARRRTDPAEVPLTSSRAVRLALTKAANDTIGLVLTVMGMGEDVQPLDDLLGGLDDTLMLIGLQRNGQLAGILALDMQMRAAVMEMQTVGRLIAKQAEDRTPTGTDKTMCDPVLAAFLTALPLAMAGTELDGWVDGALLGDRIDSRRVAGLVLDDRDYRTLRLTVDLGVADRQGALLLALPLATKTAVPARDPVDDMDWGTQFRAVVADAPASLEAQLHRFTIPLAQARALRAGQVLPLPGCTVNSVRIMSPDGHKIAQAKLGQLGGMRAVRIEQAPAPQMRDLGATGLSGMMALDAAEPLGFQGDDPLNAGDAGLIDGAPDTGGGNAFDSDSGLDVVPMDMDALSLTD